MRRRPKLKESNTKKLAGKRVDDIRWCLPRHTRREPLRQRYMRRLALPVSATRLRRAPVGSQIRDKRLARIMCSNGAVR